MQILFDEGQRPDGETQAIFERAAGYALERESLNPGDCQLSLFFAERDEIRALNRQYRNIDSVTDVLSFPMYGGIDDIREAAGTIVSVTPEHVAVSPILLGDIVICGEVAALQAEEYGHSIERELVYLFVHSLFHLLGYDHEDADGKSGNAMRAAEEDVLNKVGIVR